MMVFHGISWEIPSGNDSYIANWKMAIEIVFFFPWKLVIVHSMLNYQRVYIVDHTHLYTHIYMNEGKYTYTYIYSLYLKSISIVYIYMFMYIYINIFIYIYIFIHMYTWYQYFPKLPNKTSITMGSHSILLQACAYGLGALLCLEETLLFLERCGSRCPRGTVPAFIHWENHRKTMGKWWFSGI